MDQFGDDFEHPKANHGRSLKIKEEPENNACLI
jgi:hypothetical protein